MKTPKYKICKIENGNGRVYYIVKKKKYFWWTTIQAYDQDRRRYKTLDFYTFSQACEWVDMLKSITVQKYNDSIKKVLECTEI